MLVIRGLTKYFGGLAAVHDLDLDVERGMLVGLIGPNGAGKTTVFNLLTGFLRPSAGSVVFEGRDITGKPPHYISRCGIVRTFQTPALYEEFTVFENVTSAVLARCRFGLWSALCRGTLNRLLSRGLAEKVTGILRLFGLEELEHEVVRGLTHGYKRILGIAIAFACEPKLLLLDEPLSGMNAEETNRCSSLIRSIWERGTAILLIEHNMRAAMKLCQKIVVLETGRKICEGSPEEVRKSERVIRAYLGEGRRA
jgi:branched-chain amino acid transport system ATP-binding protein